MSNFNMFTNRMAGEPISRMAAVSLFNPSNMEDFKEIISKNKKSEGRILIRVGKSPHWQNCLIRFEDGIFSFKVENATDIIISMSQVISLKTDSSLGDSTVQISASTAENKYFLRFNDSNEMKSWLFIFQKSVAIVLAQLIQNEDDDQQPSRSNEASSSVTDRRFYDNRGNNQFAYKKSFSTSKWSSTAFAENNKTINPKQFSHDDYYNQFNKRHSHSKYNEREQSNSNSNSLNNHQFGRMESHSIRSNNNNVNNVLNNNNNNNYKSSNASQYSHDTASNSSSNDYNYSNSNNNVSSNKLAHLSKSPAIPIYMNNNNLIINNNSSNNNNYSNNHDDVYNLNNYNNTKIASSYKETTEAIDYLSTASSGGGRRISHDSNNSPKSPRYSFDHTSPRSNSDDYNYDQQRDRKFSCDDGETMMFEFDENNMNNNSHSSNSSSGNANNNSNSSNNNKGVITRARSNSTRSNPSTPSTGGRRSPRSNNNNNNKSPRSSISSHHSPRSSLAASSQQNATLLQNVAAVTSISKFSDMMSTSLSLLNTTHLMESMNIDRDDNDDVNNNNNVSSNNNSNNNSNSNSQRLHWQCGYSSVKGKKNNYEDRFVSIPSLNQYITQKQQQQQNSTTTSSNSANNGNNNLKSTFTSPTSINNNVISPTSALSSSLSNNNTNNTTPTGSNINNINSSNNSNAQSQKSGISLLGSTLSMKQKEYEEDIHKQSESVSSNEGGYFAVFDGHCGEQAAVYCKDHLLDSIYSHTSFHDNIEKAIMETCINTDKTFLEYCNTNNLNCGTTALGAFIIDNKIVVFNIGDSQAVLSCNKQPVELSKSHKPSRPDETERIVAANGWITEEKELFLGKLHYMDLSDPTVRAKAKENVNYTLINRICGEISVSRSIGDKAYKGFIPGIFQDDDFLFLWPDNHSRVFHAENLVIPNPEFMYRDITIDDEFLILASDGLWDVFTPTEVVEITRTSLLDEKNSPTVVAEKLCDLAGRFGSTDDTTIIIIKFIHS